MTPQVMVEYKLLQPHVLHQVPIFRYMFAIVTSFNYLTLTKPGVGRSGVAHQNGYLMSELVTLLRI